MSRRNQLMYLYESARLGTMRAASDKLEIEPSTISRQIARLEASFGVDLIERSRRKVILTEAGKLAVEFYRDMQAIEQTFADKIENLKSAKTGQVIISMSDALITESFQEMLEHFVRTHPELKLSIRLGGTREVINAVLEDEAHFGLAFHIATEPNITVRTSLAQPLQAVMAPSHELAGKAILELEELAGESVALPSGNLQIRQVIREAEKDQKIRLDCDFESDSPGLLKWFARNQRGVTILNRAHIRDELESGTLVAVPIRSDVLENTRASLISRAGRRLPNAARTALLSTERYFKQSFRS